MDVQCRRVLGPMDSFVWPMAMLAALAAARALPRVAMSGLGLVDEPTVRHLSGTNATASSGEGDGLSGMWPGMVLAATIMKLTASTDDVVWLLPFLVGERKKCNVPFYLLCMQLVVGISWAFSAGGAALLEQVIGEGSAWPLSKILELISAILLTLYTCKLFYDWWQERQAGEEEEEEDQSAGQEEGPPSAVPAEAAEGTSGNRQEHMQDLGAIEIQLADNAALSREVPTAAAPTCSPWSCIAAWLYGLPAPQPSASVAAAPPVLSAPPVLGVPEAPSREVVVRQAVDEVRRKDARDDKLNLRSLFTISMVGSLDDFAVFVSLLLSKAFTAWQLCLGVLLGSLTVVFVCLAAGRCNFVVRTVEKIPLWVIIGAFAVWSYVSTFALGEDH